MMFHNVRGVRGGLLGGLSGTADVKALITSTANAYGIPPALALAVAKQESGYNQSARGKAGEVGVFQLMPATAAGLHVDPYNLADNIHGGVTYLAQMLRKYGDAGTALAAYNAGPGNVDRGIIPASTQAYVASVLSMANLTQPDVDPGPVYYPTPGTPATPATPTGVWEIIPYDMGAEDPTTATDPPWGLITIAAAGFAALVLTR